MKWYVLGITMLCIMAFLAGMWDLGRRPDIAQGIGVVNYYLCLTGTLMGTWIGLWALGNVIRTPRLNVPPCK